MATLSAAQVDGGSSDNCSLDTMFLDAYNFDCDDVSRGPTVLVSDSATYTISIALEVVAVTPDRTDCTYGYTQNIDVAYDISFEGSDIPSSMDNLQGYLVFDDGSTLYLSALPKTAGAGVLSLSRYVDTSDCSTISVSTLNYSHFKVTIGDSGVWPDPGLSTQELTIAPIVTNNVTLTVEDLEGLSDYCETEVFVLDTLPPWPSVEPQDTLIASPDYTPENPAFVDNCSLETVTWVMTGATRDSSASTGINYVGSSTFEEGITTITYTATDASANTTEYHFDVILSLGCLEYLSATETGLAYGVYLIQSAADLICLSNSPVYWDKYICQIVDIDLDIDNDDDYAGGSWGLTDGTVLIDEGDWNMDGLVEASDASGFVMIGQRDVALTPFTGSYQGASWDGVTLTLGIDRRVDDLFIDFDGNWGAGLFGRTEGALIRNIHLGDVDITAHGQVGALVAYAISSTVVADCSSSGLVVGDGREIGGLIGYSSALDLSGSSSSCTVLSKVSSTDANTQLCAGALVGKVDWNGQISNCSASGDVYGEFTHNVGGLVGHLNRATIEASYATGYVQGNLFVGGLIGYAWNSTVTNAYSTGAVKGNEAVGAFLGSDTLSSAFSNLYATGNVAQSGASSALGAFVGYVANSPVFTACYYDEETTEAGDSLLPDQGNLGDHAGITALSSADFNVSGNFSFTGTAWQYDANALGRPYLAWQNDGLADYNVSNPVPTLIENGFSQEATYLGSGIVTQGLRYSHLDSLPQSWIEVSPATSTSGNTFTIEQDALEDGIYYVQPYLIKADGSYEYGDMSCLLVADFPLIISTDSVTMITEETAKLWGLISEARKIVEYGFCYSESALPAALLIGSATVVPVYSSLSSDFYDEAVSVSVSGLNNRSGIYFRLYVKDLSGDYTYGEVIRFITEKRDFSLVLDGEGDALVIDESSTANEINDWGAADNAFSVEFWMRKGSISTAKQMLLSNANGGDGYSLYLANGLISLTNTLATASSALSIDDTTWHYVALSYDGNEAIIYVDGDAGTAEIMSITAPTSTSCFIGAAYDGTSLEDEFNGHLDAMRFWNVSLSADQVYELAYDNIQEGSTANTVEGVASAFGLGQSKGVLGL